MVTNASPSCKVYVELLIVISPESCRVCFTAVLPVVSFNKSCGLIKLCFYCLLFPLIKEKVTISNYFHKQFNANSEEMFYKICLYLPCIVWIFTCIVVSLMPNVSSLIKPGLMFLNNETLIVNSEDISNSIVVGMKFPYMSVR